MERKLETMHLTAVPAPVPVFIARRDEPELQVFGVAFRGPPSTFHTRSRYIVLGQCRRKQTLDSNEYGLRRWRISSAVPLVAYANAPLQSHLERRGHW